MNTMLTSKTLSTAVIMAMVLALPGCDWFSNGKKSDTVQSSIAHDTDLFVSDGSDVIASIAGKPLLTEKVYEENLKMLLEDPQLQQLKNSLLPAQFEALIAQYMQDERLLEGSIAQRLINYHIKQKGIDQTPEYQRDLQDFIERIKTNLNATYFSKLYPIDVTDAEIEKYYKEKRDAIPQLIISRGGILAKGVSFADETKAKEFWEKAKGKAAQLEKLAQDEQLGDAFRDFKLINKDSLGVDKAVRDKVLSFTKFPALAVVKDKDNTFWVVAGLAKEEPKYHPFEQVKERLKAQLMQEKQAEVLGNAINNLKEEYKVEISEEWLAKRRERSKQQQAPLAMQLDADFNDVELEPTDSPLRAA